MEPSPRELQALADLERDLSRAVSLPDFRRSHTAKLANPAAALAAARPRCPPSAARAHPDFRRRTVEETGEECDEHGEAAASSLAMFFFSRGWSGVFFAEQPTKRKTRAAAEHPNVHPAPVVEDVPAYHGMATALGCNAATLHADVDR